MENRAISSASGGSADKLQWQNRQSDHQMRKEISESSKIERFGVRRRGRLQGVLHVPKIGCVHWWRAGPPGPGRRGCMNNPPRCGRNVVKVPERPVRSRIASRPGNIRDPAGRSHKPRPKARPTGRPRPPWRSCTEVVAFDEPTCASLSFDPDRRRTHHLHYFIIDCTPAGSTSIFPTAGV